MWTPFKSYEGKAMSIIGRNKYMVVATSSKDAKPWAAPVFYAYDGEFNFYFVSATDSLHVRNIAENPQVALEIFDSRQPIGSADHVQMTGKAEIVGKANVDEAIELYHERLFEISGIPATKDYSAADYTEPSEFRVFKVTVTKAYINGPERRVELHLKG